MTVESYGIGELADAAGLTRRAIRFYVQQQLLPAPEGRGRGKHYDRSHLDRLRQIMELQTKGHSLDAIKRILNYEAVPEPQESSSMRARPKRSLSAELWTRIKLAEGVELNFDAARYDPDVPKLLMLKDAIRSVF